MSNPETIPLQHDPYLEKNGRIQKIEQALGMVVRAAETELTNFAQDSEASGERDQESLREIGASLLRLSHLSASAYQAITHTLETANRSHVSGLQKSENPVEDIVPVHNPEEMSFETPTENIAITEGSIVTIQFLDGKGDNVQTYLVTDKQKNLANDGSIEPLYTHLPLAGVLLGAGAEETRTYKAPNGRSVQIRVLSVR